MMPRIQANFHLYAENLERAISFYTKNFNFTFLGSLGEGEEHKWAALKVENAIIWLGKNGTSFGLILLVEKDIIPFIERLKKNDVNFFLPEDFKESKIEKDVIVETDWGKHAWFYDSERNVVMLFEPLEE